MKQTLELNMPVTEKDASFELMAMLRSRWFLAPYADDG
jgi:hypothetical protein